MSAASDYLDETIQDLKERISEYEYDLEESVYDDKYRKQLEDMVISYKTLLTKLNAIS